MSGRRAGDEGGDHARDVEKWCASCGRRIEWRKKWERFWDEVRYCSTACRRRGVRAVDRELEEALVDLLARRAATSSVCPSEAARQVVRTQGQDGEGSDDPEAWRELMEPARRAARRLVVAGRVEITQGGRVVDPSTASGPVRVRRGPDWSAPDP
ncbi:DUF2256 and DUF3253 domain-containing protein [Serinicoccus marinus]|uniref:DUF2256 and DUF3253 domain-containing protein n=1 Tax=Serinicoccus marinus TaxID=247333 RepID=UPI0003B505F1|nr:DUF2256 and DUF3253 domain-containing protein [Serinicoccus marinus]